MQESIYSKEEIKSDKLLKEIVDKYDLTRVFSRIKCINQEEEKEKFNSNYEKNIEYNPQLKYNEDLDINTKNAIKDLQEIQFPNTAIGQLLQDKQIELINTINMLKNIGNDKEFSKYSELVFGSAPENLIKKAEENIEAFLKYDPKEITKDISLEDFQKNAKEYLEKLNLKEWKIIIHDKKELSSRAAVFPNLKEIRIQKQAAPFSNTELKKILAHEIGTHVLRHENGSKHELEILQYGTSNYIATEEGLAGHNELEAANIPKEEFLFFKSLLVIMQSELKTKSFYQAYKKYLQKGINKERVWKALIRTTRGISNTNSHQVFYKDHLYLEGHYLIKDFKDKERLFIGKIGINDLHLF